MRGASQEFVGCIRQVRPLRLRAGRARRTNLFCYVGKALAGASGDGDDPCVNGRLKCGQVDAQVVGFQHVYHICQHGNGFAVLFAFANHLQREKQALLQPCGINKAQHVLDFGVFEGFLELCDCDLFFGRNGFQGVGSGKVDQVDIIHALQLAGCYIHGDAREIRHFLRKAREAVEQQAFARVRAADQQYSSHATECSLQGYDLRFHRPANKWCC